MKNPLFLGSVFSFFAVLLGAFGAHTLKTHLDEAMLQIFKTGVLYQMFHALGLLVYGLFRKSLGMQNEAITKQLPSLCFSLGIILFSGSLYALSISGLRVFGAITPLGGLLFLIGWISFALETNKFQNSKN